MTEKSPVGFSGNTLKLVAAICMFIDHMGAILFPQILALRIIGRLAFPIYAFMIAQGCRHTRNKLRYFLGVFLLGLFCQGVYAVFSPVDRLNILLTFSASILLLYCVLWLESSEEKKQWLHVAAAALCLVVTALAVYYVNLKFHFDYGLWGCLAAVLAGQFPAEKKSPLPVIRLGFALLGTAHTSGSIQLYSLLALPLLLCYSGHRGKYKMKYFFYIFYPAHLAVLYGIALLMK